MLSWAMLPKGGAGRAVPCVRGGRLDLNQRTMSKLLSIAPVHTENLQMTPELADNGIVLRLKGNADSASNAAFGHFVTKMHGEAQRLAVGTVHVDLTQLYFMTSSCIKCFVTWIGCIRSAPPHLQYKLNFVVNPALRWQKRNLDVLLQLSDLLTLTDGAA